MRIPPRSTSWASTLDRMKTDATPKLGDNEALKALNDLFRRTASANDIEKSGKVEVRRCTRNVSDAPTGRCGLVLLTAERGFCSFHANPVRFAAAGVEEGEVYNNSPLMRDHLAP